MRSIHFSPETISEDLERFGISTLRDLVLQTSESHDPAGVSLVQEQLAHELHEVGLEVRFVQVPGEGNDARGPILVAGTKSGFENGAIALIAHSDTVHREADFSNVFDVTIKDGHRVAFGPGALDLKGSTMSIMLALRELKRLDLLGSLPLRIVFNSAEECGTDQSRQTMIDAVRGSSIALVFEFGRNNKTGNPLLVVARPGLVDFEIQTRGQSGHIRDSHSLVSASELGTAVSSKLFEIARSTNGLSSNLYSVDSHSAENVLPGSSTQAWEIRALNEEALNQFLHNAERACQSLAESLSKGAPLSTPSLRVLQRAPVLPGTPKSARLGRAYAERAATVGVPFEVGAELGGLSDANVLQALDIPIIDGLGASGGGAHTNKEFVRLDDITRKALGFLAWLQGVPSS